MRQLLVEHDCWPRHCSYGCCCDRSDEGTLDGSFTSRVEQYSRRESTQVEASAKLQKTFSLLVSFYYFSAGEKVCKLVQAIKYTKDDKLY